MQLYDKENVVLLYYTTPALRAHSQKAKSDLTGHLCCDWSTA